MFTAYHRYPSLTRHNSAGHQATIYFLSPSPASSNLTDVKKMALSQFLKSKVPEAMSTFFNFKQIPDPITMSRSPSCDSEQPFLEALRPAQPKGPLTEFTLFPELPIELRLLIWKLALRKPCLIELYDKVWDHYSPAIAPNSMTSLLPLLKTCRESHQVISETYRKIYASDLALIGMSSNSVFWIDDENDALFFHTRSYSTNQILTLATPESLNPMKKIVLMLEPLVMRTPQFMNVESLSSLPSLLTRFEGLEEMVMAARLPNSRFLPDPDVILRVDHGRDWGNLGGTYGVQGFEVRVQRLLRVLMGAPWKEKRSGGPVEVTFSEFFSGERERKRWSRR